MDIHTWLQTTADRQPPDEEEHPGISDFLKLQGPPEAKRRERHRTRILPPGEPPSSERHQHRRKRHRAATWSSSSPDHARRLRHPLTGSRSSSHPSYRRHVRGTTDEKEVTRKSFERRARHKTRPDRYEAKPKQRSDGRKARDERESKSKGRKSRQNGDIAKAAGMIQSFQLKNGRKDKRLTLRPDANVGIFKHGRSSAPIATNGPGLPDLVFNEMKFLQRPHEHQDELLANDAAPRQSKKSKQQLREEEISAYFVKKPAPEGAAPRKRAASGGLQTNVSKYVVHRSTDQRRPTSSKLDANPAGDAVDLLQRPFLGTRSKVPNHHSNTNDPSSHLTWSESVAQRRSPRESLSHADHRATDERARDRDQGRLPTKDPGGEGLKQSRNLDTTTNEKGDRWIEIGRARRQENLERYVLADNEQATARRGTDQSAASITEFLRDSRAKQANSRSSKLSNCDETRDHRTSDVLMIIDDDRVIEPSIQPRHQHSDERQNRSSTPTSDLLRRAFDAVNNATANKPSQLDRTQPIGQGRMESRQRQGEVNIHDTGHRPASHAHGSHAANAEEHATVPRRGFSRAAGTQNTQHRRPLQSLSASKMNAGPRWRPPTGLISSTHKQHRTRDDILDDIQGDFSRSVGAKDARQRQPYQPMSASTMNASPQRRPPSKFERVQMMHHERLTEDDMPDNLQDAAPTRSPGSYVYPDNRFVQSQEVDLHQPIPHERDQIYVDLPARQLVTYSPKFGADLLSVRGPSSGLHGAALSNLSTDRLSGLPSSGENDEVQRADDGMDGFWRPNVLY